MILDRRTFLLGLAGAALAGCKKTADGPAPTKPRPPPASPPAPVEATPPRPTRQTRQADVLDAALERIVPGAGEAKVRRYIDGQLALPHFSGLKKMVFHGSKLLDKVARREAGGPFMGLAGDLQDDLLTRFQTGQVKTKFPTAKWFAVVHAFALEGWLGDPRHGGNADGRGWKSVGWELQCPAG